MSRLLHRPGLPADRKVLLATPSYGAVEPGYAFAIFESAAALAEAGITCEYAILAGNCHVDDSRNSLVKTFLGSDCTDLVFLDGDLRWEAKDLLALLSFDRDVVASGYPLKDDDEEFTIEFLPGEIWSDRDGLIEVEAVPTGFLRIRRHVLELLASKAQKYVSKEGDDPTPLIFERTMEDGRRWGGDYTFCRKWRAAGGKVYVAPQPCLQHAGTKEWAGSLASYLRRKNGIALAAGLAAIREGREDARLLNDMITEWENPYAATPEILAATIMIARQCDGPILECGSGLTTLAMAAANPNVPIHALEHDAGWTSRMSYMLRPYPNVALHYAPLMDDWYVVPDSIPREYSFALVDGPANGAVRDGILRSGLRASAYLLDDARYPSVTAVIDGLGGTVRRLGSVREFAIVRPA